MIKILYVRAFKRLPRDYEFIKALDKHEDISLVICTQYSLRNYYNTTKALKEKLCADVVINFTRDLSISRRAEAENILLLNKADPASIANDKWKTYKKLETIGIPQPKTSLTQDFKAPYIYKDRMGSFGNNIKLITEDTLLQPTNPGYIFQEYIAESAGKSIRVVMIDKKPVAWLLKVNKKSFLSHYRHGGESYSFEMTPEVEEICCKAAECLDLNYCAIDLLLSNRGPLLLEVNSGAGITGIKDFTGVDVPKLVIDFIIEKYNNKEKKEA